MVAAVAVHRRGADVAYHGAGRGRARTEAATLDGAVLRNAERDKKKKYCDVLVSPLAELLVLGGEVGGRWSLTAQEFVTQLAELKVEGSTPVLRRACYQVM